MMLIAEVSKRFDLSQDTLRYYERIGLIPAVPRNKNGIRNYTEESCNWVEFIKCMRGAGLPIEMLIDYVALFQQGDAMKQTRKAMLIEQRDQLIARIENFQQVLQRLNLKIQNYDYVASVEKKMGEHIEKD